MESSSLFDAVSLLIISRNSGEVLVKSGASGRYELPHKLASNHDPITTLRDLKEQLFSRSGITNQPVEVRLHKILRIWPVSLPREVALLPPKITHYCVLASIDGVPGSFGDEFNYFWFSLDHLRRGDPLVCFELLDSLNELPEITDLLRVLSEPDVFCNIPTVCPQRNDDSELKSIAYECGLTRNDEIALQMLYMKYTWPSVMMDYNAFQEFLPWSRVFNRLDKTRLDEHLKRLFVAICSLPANANKDFLRFEVLSFALALLQVVPSSSRRVLEKSARLIFTFYAGSSDTMTDEQFSQFERDASQYVEEIQPAHSSFPSRTDISNLQCRGVYNGRSFDNFLELFLSRTELHQHLLFWNAKLSDMLGATPNLITSLLAPTVNERIHINRERCRRVVNMTSEIEAACSSLHHRNVISLISNSAEQNLATSAFVAHGKEFTRYVRSVLKRIDHELNQLPGKFSDHDEAPDALHSENMSFTALTSSSSTPTMPQSFIPTRTNAMTAPFSDHYPNSAT